MALPALFGLGLILVPLVSLLQRSPWGHLGEELRRPEVADAVWLSLKTSAGALGLSLLFGVPLAWLLARVDFPGRNLIRALVTLPMVLPPVVGGVALLYAFAGPGIPGRALYALTGLRLPFTTAGAVVAATFVAMPFLVVTAESGFRLLDERLENAAATLGAGPWQRFRYITLPLVGPALSAGAALTWARALGEFGATITFAGNLQGTTQTLPLAVYVAFERSPDAAVTISLLLLAISVGVLVALRSRWASALS